MSALNPIFCGVGLDRTPLLTRVRVLPWQKDTFQEVEGRGEKKGEQEKKDRKGERKRSLQDLLVLLHVGRGEIVCWRNGCQGWGRTRLKGRPGDEDKG